MFAVSIGRNFFFFVLSGLTPAFPYSQQDQASANQGFGSWLEGMNSPLVQQEGDCKQLKLRFDVSQYKPEEIVVKTVDNKLLVSTKSIFVCNSKQDEIDNAHSNSLEKVFLCILCCSICS